MNKMNDLVSTLLKGMDLKSQDMIVGDVEHPGFDLGHPTSWRTFIPHTVKIVWDQLPIEARLVAHLMASMKLCECLGSKEDWFLNGNCWASLTGVNVYRKT